MPVNSDEILNVLAVLSDQENLRVTVKHSVKGGLIAGGSTFLGGVLLGPVGMAVGGILGACSAALMSKDQFQPVSYVIMYQMSLQEKQRLVESVQNIINDLRLEDATVLLPMILNKPGCQRLLLQLLTEFVRKEMRLEIID